MCCRSCVVHSGAAAGRAEASFSLKHSRPHDWSSRVLATSFSHDTIHLSSICPTLFKVGIQRIQLGLLPAQSVRTDDCHKWNKSNKGDKDTGNTTHECEDMTHLSKPPVELAGPWHHSASAHELPGLHNALFQHAASLSAPFNQVCQPGPP